MPNATDTAPRTGEHVDGYEVPVLDEHAIRIAAGIHVCGWAITAGTVWRRLFDALAATRGVLQVFHIAGADDFLVHVAVADAAALRDIVLERITVHEIVRATETQLVFELREGAGAVPRP